MLALVAFVSGMSPLAALTPPFSWFVTVETDPEGLLMEADVTAVDPALLSETLHALAASQGLTDDDPARSDVRNPAFYQASFSDAADDNILVTKSAGQYQVQVFQHRGSSSAIDRLVDATSRALAPLGFARHP